MEKQTKNDFIKRLIKFTLIIIKLTRNLPKTISNDIFARQIIRSSANIGANVMEARGSSTKKDYARFFSIALKSANETKYWLILIQSANPEQKEKYRHLLEENDEIARLSHQALLRSKVENNLLFEIYTFGF